MPGLALLELARGDTSAAAATIRRALTEASHAYQRPGLLAASVEIHLASGQVEPARDAAEELAEIAAGSRSEMLRAVAEQAAGASMLGAGEAEGAMPRLRGASASWQKLNMPYETARTSVLIGHGCTVLGDTTSARLEYERARELFESLNAGPDLEGLGSPTTQATHLDILSPRELEVLTLVADGRTSREIAESLVISRPHRATPHREHLHEARRQQPRRGHGARLRAGPALSLRASMVAFALVDRRRSAMGHRSDVRPVATIVRCDPSRRTRRPRDQGLAKIQGASP